MRPAHRNRRESAPINPRVIPSISAGARAGSSPSQRQQIGLPNLSSTPLDLPVAARAGDRETSGEEFFRIEGVYTGLGAPIPGGEIGRWLLVDGPHIDSEIELFDELCWRLLGDGVPLWRASLHTGTLHPQIRGARRALVARPQGRSRITASCTAPRTPTNTG